jgi:hypothetical protein
VMRLDQFLGEKLFVRTLSKGPAPLLDDPAIVKAAKGADVFLDTVSRFATGDENAAADVKNFSAQLFGMLEAGARSVWAAHHSPKAFGDLLRRSSVQLRFFLLMLPGVREVRLRLQEPRRVVILKIEDRLQSQTIRIPQNRAANPEMFDFSYF